MSAAADVLADMDATPGASPRDMGAAQIAAVRAAVLGDLFLFATVVFGYKDLAAVHREIAALLGAWGTPGYRRLMVQIPRGHFKCQKGDVLVHTRHGVTQLRNVVAGDEIATLDDQLRLAWVRVVAKQTRADAPLVRICLGTGLVIEVTPHHPLRTVLGWVRADALVPGTGIAAARQLPRPEREYVRPYSAGAICGDGCGAGRTITCHDDEILNRMRAEGTTLRSRSARRTYGIPLVHWPEAFRCGAWDKYIPVEYEGSGSFLSGLYDTDGHVGMASGGTVNLVTVSEALARDVQRNLRYFGIVARINKVATKKPSGEPSSAWFVDFRGAENARRFQKSIGFQVVRKAVNLQKIVDRNEPRSASRDWCVPPEWRGLLIQRARGHRGGFSDIRKLREAGLRCDNQYWTNQSKVAEAAAILGRSDLLSLASPDVCWDEVVSVELAPPDEIVEIEVDSPNSYIGDCVLHHNTSLCTIANSLWQVCRDADAPIAIFNEKEDNAAMWVRAIRETVQNSVVFQTLFPELLPPGIHIRDREKGLTLPRTWKWTDTELLFQRGAYGIPEPSIMGLGIGSASAGRHWPKIIKDDIISEDAKNSPLVMERARDWADHSFSLEQPALGGQDLYACTPWHYSDVYAHVLQREYGYKLLRRSAFTEDGDVLFPEKFARETLEAMQRADPYSFSSQFMCRPRPGKEVAFEHAWLRFGNVRGDSFAIDRESFDATINPADVPEKPTRVVPLSAMEKCILVDPIPDGETDRRLEPGCRHAVLVMGHDYYGRKYLLDVWVGRCDPLDLIVTILGLCAQWACDRVGIEKVAFSVVYRHWLREEARRRSVPYLTLIDLEPGRRQKDARIRAKIAPTRQGIYYIERGVEREFVREYLEYPYGTTRDILDAWAYDSEPGILPRPLSPQEQQQYDDLHDVQARIRAGADSVTGY